MVMRNYSIEDLAEFATEEEHKEHLLTMLDAFVVFCEEHNLRYFLSGGTLLGAIRHKGFIPWDDDVDVNMPRPDCEKLMELCGGRIGNYILQEPNYTQSYHAYHYKLYDESILVAKQTKDILDTKIYPIFIDIFPIEGLPDTDKATVVHYNKLRAAKEEATGIWSYKSYMGRNPISKAKRKAKLKAIDLVGRKKLFDDVVAIQTSISFDEAKYVGVMSTNVHFEEERILKEDYMKVIEVEFEGRKLAGPSNYDTYLRQLYGDNYMNIPPIYKRVSKHRLLPFHSKFGNSFFVNKFDWEKWHNYWCPGKADIKVAICGLIKSENIGELFIARSLEYLIGTECRRLWPDMNIDFVEVDLHGRNDHIENVKGGFNKKIANYGTFRASEFHKETLFNSLREKSNNLNTQFGKNVIHRYRNYMWNKSPNHRQRLEKYFNEKFVGVDFIAIDGAGLLEYSYNEYAWPLMLVSMYAEKHGIDVIYNAIGRAGEYNPKDFRSKALRRAIRSSAVKYVSARDSVEDVQDCASPNQKVKLLADAAFWMKETYKLERDEDSKKIGIGIVRGSSLLGYGVNYTEDDWIGLFAEIATTLDKRGYDYEFFTNGLPSDVELGIKVLEKLGLPNTKLVQRPIDDVELYSTICGYQALITCRMHSSIAAFTQKIPSVILSWNKKVNKLMEIVGYPERAIDIPDFDGDYIVDAMERAIEEGVTDEKLNVMKAKSQESVQDYINLIINKAKSIQTN